MELIFTGTGSGATSFNRRHSSLTIKNKDHFILIDCGDGISNSLMSCKIPFNLISHIIISHFHPDHIGGFTSLITQMKLKNRKKELVVYLPEGKSKTLLHWLDDTYLFPEKLGFKIKPVEIKSSRVTKIEKNVIFAARENSHLANKNNITRIKKEKFCSLSFLLQLGDTDIVYTSDIGSKDDLFLFKDFAPDIFISESTHVEPIDLIEAINTFSPEFFILTHIPDETEEVLKEFVSLRNSQSNTKVMLAHDKMVIKV